MNTKVPAPFLISGMICTIVSHGSGITTGSMIPIFSIFAFIILGIVIGARFVSIDLKLLKTSVFQWIFTNISWGTIFFIFCIPYIKDYKYRIS